MKKKIVFIGPFSIPVTGNSIVNDTIFDKLNQSSSFQIKKINTSYPEFNEEAGTFSFSKFLFYLSTNFQSYKLVGAHIIYISIGQTYLGILKNALPLLLAKLFHQKIIIHLHGNELGHNYEKASAFQKKVFRFFLKLPDKAIVLSPYLKHNLSSFFKDTNIDVLPNFAEDSMIAARNEMEKKDYSTLKLFFLSNLMTEKGIFELLNALQLLQDKGVYFSTELYGAIDKKIEPKLFSLIQNLGNFVTYKGVISNNDKKYIFLQNNTFILPSYNEGMPLSILEAMATGNIIITTHLPGLKDILIHGENSLLVQKKNVQQIADTLEKINKNPKDYATYCEKNYTSILENFTEKKFFVRLFKIIDEL